MTNPTIKILLIEDNPADVRLLREAQARQSLGQSTSDVILSDLGLPDAQGLETVRQIHSVAPGLPVVVLTSLNDDFFGSQVLRDGAQDYLVKGQIGGRLLWRALRHAMERHQV